VLPQVGGDLLCFCGDQDPLMPPEELKAIATGPGGLRLGPAPRAGGVSRGGARVSV